MSESVNYNSIVTHFDLDGVACAALCSLFFDIEKVTFAGPSNMDRFSYDENTLVTDLPNPYPKECGFWFDHHMANIEELTYLGVDHTTLPGLIEPKPSCLRVIFDHYSKEYEIEDFEPFVKELDVIDGFLFRDYAHWMEVTPAKNLDHAIKYDYNDFSFMRELVFKLRDDDYTVVAEDSEVLRRAELFRKQELEQLPTIEKVARELDENGEIILVDLTGLRNPPKMEKNLTYNFFPKGKSVITARSIYQRGQKTNGLSFSMSLGFVEDEIKEKIDIGKMMRELEIGSGHPGAAAGRFDCKSKDEREKRKKNVLSEVLRMWSEQKNQ